jgi:hypothetical protein
MSVELLAATATDVAQDGPAISYVNANDGRRLQYNFCTQEEGKGS